jgi:DNA-binding LytR/AlgR family response regulator
MGEIVIIDDDQHFALLLKKEIQPFFLAGYEILIFNSFDKKYFENQGVDVAFLDIEMGEDNGIEVAKKIKELENHPIIIFVSNHEGFVHNTLAVQPLYFIRKPMLKEDVKSAFTLLKQIKKRTNETIEVGDIIIRINDILYIESSDHKITFVTKNDYYSCRGTLESVGQLLEEHDFVRAHRSFILNIHQIECHYRTRVVLKTGQRIDIGRKYQAEVREKYKEAKLNGII